MLRNFWNELPAGMRGWILVAVGFLLAAVVVPFVTGAP